MYLSDINYTCFLLCSARHKLQGGGRSSHSPVSGTIGKVFKETLGALPTYIGLKAKYSDYCPPQLVK